MKTCQEILEHKRALDRARASRYYYKKKELLKQQQEPEAEAPKKETIKKYSLEHCIQTIEENNPLKENREKNGTVEKYTNDIKRLYYITEFNNFYDLLKDTKPAKLIKSIKTAKQQKDPDKIFSTGTIVGVIQVINRLIHYFNLKDKLPETTINAYNREWELLTATDKVGRENKRRDEDEAVMKFTEFIKLLETKNLYNVKIYPLAKLFYEVPVRDDLCLTIIDKGDQIKKNINYLILKNNKPYEVLIQHSKALSENINVKLSNELIKILNNYMIDNNLKSGDILFNTPSGKNTRYISDYMKKLKLKGSIIEWRKMRVACVDKNDIEGRLKLSKIMGHDIMTQQNYQRVLIDKDADKPKTRSGRIIKKVIS